MKNPTLTFANPPPAILITEAQLLALGIPQSAIDAGEMRGESTHRGPWHIITSYRALCLSSVFDRAAHGFTPTRATNLYGMRSLNKPRESGYCLEGFVSIGGRRYSAFTSSQLFELPDGRLLEFATIHARKD
jgi:hypothetical protein